MRTMIRRIFGRGPQPKSLILPRYRHAEDGMARNDEAFATALNRSIGKLMSDCKRADPAALPRIKRALAHLNAARTLYSLGYVADARTIVARCFMEVRQYSVAGLPALH